MFKRILCIILTVEMLFLIGCSTQKNAAEPILTVTDANGDPVAFRETPTRVAVLFSSLADIWLTAGGDVHITVGESVERKFADSTVILVDSGAGKSINTEILLAANPDFVIGSADIPAQVEAVALCRQVGIPAGVFRVESFSDYLNTLNVFTDITGHKENFAVYGSDLEAQIIEKIELFLKNSNEKSFIFIRSGSGSRSMKAKTNDEHFACQMLSSLGLTNIADLSPVIVDGLSIEEIIRQNPDYIFVSTMGDETAAISYTQSVFSQPQWSSLQAVRNGNVIYLPKDLFQYKPNQRWLQAYEYLIDILQ